MSAKMLDHFWELIDRHKKKKYKEFNWAQIQMEKWVNQQGLECEGTRHLESGLEHGMVRSTGYWGDIIERAYSKGKIHGLSRIITHHDVTI